MRKLFGVTLSVTILILALLQTGITSCTKDRTIYDTVVVVHRDTSTVLFKDSTPVVDAGRDTTYQIWSLSDSIQLAGSAKDALDPIVSYLWSEVSGPNVPSILSSGSPATYVTGLVAGNYVFQLMAVDSDGEVGVKTVKVTVQLRKLTLTTQPANNNTEVHMEIAGSVDATDPNAPELAAVAWTSNGSPAYARGLLKFDLSSIPTNAKITSAKLTLWSDPTPLNGNQVDANYGTDNTLLIQRVSSPWNNTVKWQTQPATDPSNEVVIPSTTQSRLDLTDIDVTNLVQAMVQSGNYGFELRLQSENIYTSRIFCSSKYNDASKHPKLVVQVN